MKTKLLFILLSVLFIIPMSAMPHKKHRHKVNTKIINSHSKSIFRSPLFFNLTADEIDDNLTITFQSALEEADITVTDKDGNVVVSEFKTSIYEGKTVKRLCSRIGYLYYRDNLSHHRRNSRNHTKRDLTNYFINIKTI